MNRKRWIIILLAVATVLLWPLADRSMSVFAQATTTMTNERIPMEFDQFSDCLQEDTHVSFVNHLINKITFDPNGGVHFKFHANASNLKVVGLTTGRTAVGSQNANQVFEGSVSGEPPWEFTYVQTVKGGRPRLGT